MSKYYTPEIEEFYVGFEFEVKDNDWHPCIIGGYSDYDIVALDEILSPCMDVDLKKFRVKHIDKKDIESLGFFCHATDERVFHNKNGIIINTGWGSPVKEGITLAVVSPVFDESKMNIIHEHYLFNGTIKNKSELKKLLKQLGI